MHFETRAASQANGQELFWTRGSTISLGTMLGNDGILRKGIYNGCISGGEVMGVRSLVTEIRIDSRERTGTESNVLEEKQCVL